jgi:hypothetical protein
MPYWCHFLLSTVTSLTGVALWWALIVYCWPFKTLERIVPNLEIRSALLFVACALGLGVDMLLTQWFCRIPARCRKCGGKSFGVGNRPVRYVCRDCGYLEITNFRRNLGRR